MSETCRAPDGASPCPFSIGPTACWPSIQSLEQKLGNRGMDCPFYVMQIQAEAYRPPDEAA